MYGYSSPECMKSVLSYKLGKVAKLQIVFAYMAIVWQAWLGDLYEYILFLLCRIANQLFINSMTCFKGIKIVAGA